MLFQRATKSMKNTVARPGSEMGRKMPAKMRSSDAPSMRADYASVKLMDLK
jgi:hypothetical protein